MKYKIELIGNNKLLENKVYDKLTHPNQAIRKILSLLSKNISLQYFTIYVMNVNGEVWVYGVERNTYKKYKAIPITHDFVGKQEIIQVFSGSKNIRGMV